MKKSYFQHRGYSREDLYIIWKLRVQGLTYKQIESNGYSHRQTEAAIKYMTCGLSKTQRKLFNLAVRHKGILSAEDYKAFSESKTAKFAEYQIEYDDDSIGSPLNYDVFDDLEDYDCLPVLAFVMRGIS